MTRHSTLRRIGIIILTPYVYIWCIYLSRNLPLDIIESTVDGDGVGINFEKHLHNFKKDTDEGYAIDTKVQPNPSSTTGIEPLVLKAYLEPKPPPDWDKSKPLPTSQVTSDLLTVTSFPHAYDDLDCSIGSPIQPFPIIDEYPDGDSYLPWIHDVFVSQDGSHVHFIAQNRRRCHTGKDNIGLMKDMEGQIALFQPVAVKRISKGLNSTYAEGHLGHEDGGENVFRLASYEDADEDGMETRFICQFQVLQHGHNPSFVTTLSTYPFNYEFIAWKKGSRVMFSETGKDMEQFWLSNLQFNCPVPPHITPLLASLEHGIGTTNSKVYMNIVSIRTPPRRLDEHFFSQRHGGPMNFNATSSWGDNHILPQIKDSGRWENIRICPSQLPWTEDANEQIVKDRTADKVQKKTAKRFNLVACTWTSASHNRRGDARTVYGGRERLKEWISFHLLVGFDHIVVYDNTIGASDHETNETNETLKDVTDLFSSSKVTHVNFNCKICNNNRPASPDPGERSSQYAAESSCRARFGPHTEWMAFFDPDEYFVPMGSHMNWKELLSNERAQVLKFRSTAARPRLDLMVPTYDTSAKCEKDYIENNGKAPCLTRSPTETFLRTYNCEYIKSPKPSRFQRAMKQIYRPDYVLSHFVHYSTVTKDLAMMSRETADSDARKVGEVRERFVDEINEGCLVHAKTKTPDETIDRVKRCQYGSEGCAIGIPCHDDVEFHDETHKKGFLNEDGKYCNCWINKKLENVFLPALERKLRKATVQGTDV